jgi:HSP20 family molecular chaperone IbpA
MAEQAHLTGKERAEQGWPESTRGGVHFTPRVDIYELENELVLYADLPGVRAEDVELRYERGELTLHGKVRRRQRPEQFNQWEYEEGDFFRVFQVHESIDGARIEAECKNGVLTVHLPKVEAASPRQVKVRGE